MQHSYLGEDVKVIELLGFFVIAERVPLRCFGQILAAGVFVEYCWSRDTSVRNVQMEIIIGRT